MENEKKKKIVLTVIGILVLVVGIVGLTYAYFIARGQSEEIIVTSNSLKIGFAQGNLIRATDIEPIEDVEIKTSATELPFSVTNTGDKHLNLTIKLIDINISEEFKDIDFRWGLYNADTDMGLSFGTFKDIGTEKEITIYKDTIIDAADPDITNNYKLRIWIHENGADQVDLQDKTFSGKVEVTGEKIEYTSENCFAFNEGTGEIEYYKAEYDDGNANLISCPTDIVVPRTINDVTVKGVSLYPRDAYLDFKVTSVIIPNTVTSINAIVEQNLTHITIPEGVTDFVNGALSYNKLTSIYIPESVTSINEGVFRDNQLTSIVIPSSVKNFYFGASEGSFQNNKLTSVVLMEGITDLGYHSDYKLSYLFQNNKLTEIEIPSSVTTIGSDAFANNPNLTKIVVRGKTSLADFTVSTGLSELTNVNIIFRP